MDKIDKNLIRIVVSSADIRENRSIGKNQFNGNTMYNAEKYLVQDALDNLAREWRDIETYDYSCGLMKPLHMEDGPRVIKGIVDGYNIIIKLREE